MESSREGVGGAEHGPVVAAVLPAGAATMPARAPEGGHRHDDVSAEGRGGGWVVLRDLLLFP
jgi:hypothetical protein